MSKSNFRARRPASPPPLSSTLASDYSQPQQSTARFPHNKADHLDADARLTQAKLDPSRAAPGLRRAGHGGGFGGINMSGMEWNVLLLVTLLAGVVRTYKISWPDSVV